MDIQVKIKVPIYSEDDEYIKYYLDTDAMIDISLIESAWKYIDKDEKVYKNWSEIQFKSGISIVVNISLARLHELRKQCEDNKLKAFLN